jgi:hypothetical protein
MLELIVFVVIVVVVGFCIRAIIEDARSPECSGCQKRRLGRSGWYVHDRSCLTRFGPSGS